MKNILTWGIVFFLFIGSPVWGQHSLLNHELQPFPDLDSGYIDITYNALTDAFVASGFGLTIDDDGEGGVINFDVMGSSVITAIIDETGTFVSGDLSIGGQVLGAGASGPLLTGTLTNFGYAFFDTANSMSDSAVLEWQFGITGGDLADLFGGIDGFVGVIFSSVSFTSGSITETQFTANFDNNYGFAGLGMATSTTAPNPEPATLGMLVFGVIVSRLRRRRS